MNYLGQNIAGVPCEWTQTKHFGTVQTTNRLGDLNLTRVAVCEEGADWEEDLWDGEGGTPVVLENVEADDALAVDVAVVDPGSEGHLKIDQVVRPVVTAPGASNFW